MKNIKNIYSPLIWLVLGIIFLVIGLNIKIRLFLFLLAVILQLVVHF